MSDKANSDQLSLRKQSLVNARAAFGPVMSPDEICSLLKYPTRAALLAAVRRRKLPVRLIRLPGRPGVYAVTDEVFSVLAQSFGVQPNTILGGDQTM